LLLANQGLNVEELVKIFQVSYKTIYNWFDRWEAHGMMGLYTKKGRGSKPTFTQEQKEKIKEWTKEEPRQLKRIVEKVKEEWGIITSTSTIKRILKTLNMSWHRMRRAIGGEPKTDVYQEKRVELEDLEQLDENGEIDLYYLDESGFCLIPPVPYAWQDVGEYLTIPSRHSKRLNVLGIMNKHNHLESYVSEQSITSDVIVACIDAFFPTTSKPTVIVIDQASIHTSNAIFEKLEEWKERNITIFELPTYSPQLNLIEILWRFIKYKWIPLDAYKDWTTFVASIERILKEFGEKFVINFA
jgi:transposase